MLLQVKPVHQGIILAVVCAAGIGLGVVAPAVINWALEQQWIPFQKPMQVLTAVSHKVGSWILIVIGGVVGALAGLGIIDSLSKINISDRDITFIQGRKKQRFARSQVAEALIDTGHLVLRDMDDADLIRHDLDVPADEVVTALRRYQWPVQD